MSDVNEEIDEVKAKISVLENKIDDEEREAPKDKRCTYIISLRNELVE